MGNAASVLKGSDRTAPCGKKDFYPAASRFPGRRDVYFISIVLLLGAAVRFHYLWSSSFGIDADEAIVGLMARHILEGSRPPVFYYGQNYMGGLEALLVSFSFKIFGISNIALKLVPLIFSLLLIPLVYFTGLQIWGRYAARAASVFMAVPPSALLLWSGKARGGFMEIVFIGLLSFYLAFKWIRAGRPAVVSTFVISFLLGVGWWVNNQIIFFIFPVGILFTSGFVQIFKTQGSLRVLGHVFAGALGFVIGGASFWIYNVENSFSSFGLFNFGKGSEILDHLRGVFSSALPILLGARRFWHDSDVFAGASIAVLILYGCLGLILFSVRLEQVKELFFLKVDRKRPVEILLLFIIGAVLIFSLSSFGHLVKAPRYLLPLYPVVFLAAGVALSIVWERNRFGAVFLAGTVLIFNLLSCYSGGTAVAGEPYVYKNDRVSGDHTELITWLSGQGYRYVHTGYWIGYRLAFETQERVKFSMLKDSGVVRIKSYEKEVLKFEEESGEISPFVLVHSQVRPVVRTLNARGYMFKRVELSGYTVLYRVIPRDLPYTLVRRESYELSASSKGEWAGYASDGKMDTRWGSGRPQEAGLWFSVDFVSPLTVRGVRYRLGRWRHDYPRGLVVKGERVDGSLVDLYNSERLGSFVYFTGSNYDLSLYFSPIGLRRLILIDTGFHPVLDWSIAELEILK